MHPRLAPQRPPTPLASARKSRLRSVGRSARLELARTPRRRASPRTAGVCMWTWLTRRTTTDYALPTNSVTSIRTRSSAWKGEQTSPAPAALLPGVLLVLIYKSTEKNPRWLIYLSFLLLLFFSFLLCTQLFVLFVFVPNFLCFSFVDSQFSLNLSLFFTSIKIKMKLYSECVHKDLKTFHYLDLVGSLCLFVGGAVAAGGGLGGG